MVSAEMKNNVFKIFTESEWSNFQETGQFSGSEDDIRDGFIHLSTKEQVDGVIERFFPGKHPLYVAEFSGPEFIKQLTWEASGSKDIYPHLYNLDLFTSEVTGFSER